MEIVSPGNANRYLVGASVAALLWAGPSHAACDGGPQAGLMRGRPAGLPAEAVRAAFAKSFSGATLHVFLIDGQSNAVGEGNSSQSPNPVPAGSVLMYCSTGSISPANDPVCSATDPSDNANSGSAWPSFGQSYYNSSHEPILFVQTAVGGTGQVAISGDGNRN